MTIDLREFADLKSKVESLQKKADRAQGACDQIRAQLKKEFGVDTMEEAEKLVTKLEREAREAEKTYEAGLAVFRKQWGSRLD